MTNINMIADTNLDFVGARGLKIYFTNLRFEFIWSKIYLYEDLETVSKKIYYEGVPLQKSNKFLTKEFYDNGVEKSRRFTVNGKIRSEDDDFPAIIEWSRDGKMALEIYNCDLDNEIVLTY